jgi:hypothetical protein
MTSKPLSRMPRSMTKPTAVSSALVLAGLLYVAPVWALQKLEVKPDTTVTARIALKETSRIKVDGLAIVDVFGSVYSPDNTAGELMVAPDAASGELYVMPSVMATPGKPINLFIKTEKATYTLLLTPVDIPSETVILNDRLTKASSQAGPPPTGEAPDWLRQIKNMMLVLTGESTPPGYVSVPVGKTRGAVAGSAFSGNAPGHAPPPGRFRIRPDQCLGGAHGPGRTGILRRGRGGDRYRQDPIGAERIDPRLCDPGENG